MPLLDRYLRAVRHSLLFMRKARKDDIIGELADDLRSQMEDREAALGRPLDESEQAAILQRCGHPALVAARYRGGQGTLAFGPLLIGPELFPYYVVILCLNLAITIGLFLVAVVVDLIGGAPVGRVAHVAFEWPGLALSLLIQVLTVTIIFICVQAWKHRWSGLLNLAGPPVPSPGVSRWQTITGIVFWSIAAAWWAFVPLYPPLLLGGAAARLQPGPAWFGLFLPVLLLLIAGIVQRAVYLARPTPAWFHTAARLAVNLLGLLFIYGLRSSRAFVVASAAAPDPARADSLARTFNTLIVNGFLSWIWIYLGANLLGQGAAALDQMRRWSSGRRKAGSEDGVRASR